MIVVRTGSGDAGVDHLLGCIDRCPVDLPLLGKQGVQGALGCTGLASKLAQYWRRHGGPSIGGEDLQGMKVES